MKFLGIDMGTTSLAVVVMDARNGDVVEQMTALHAADLVGEEPWERVQDAQVMVEVARRMMTEALARWDDIGGIGISGQMHGIVYVDASGVAVSPLYTWQDGRAAVASASGHTFAQWFAWKTGHLAATGWGFVTHAALVASGGIPAQAVAFCTIGDYLAMRLTDRVRPLMHPTQAAGIGVWTTGGGFDEAALARVQVSGEWLPDVSPVGSHVAVGETVRGIPVYTAIGDNQASFLGAVAQAEGTLLVNVGTGAQVSLWRADVPDAVGPTFEVRPFVDGHYLLVGATLSGGRTYAMLETFFRQVVTLFATADASACNRPLYALMSDALDRWSGSDDLLQVNTQFAGTRKEPGTRGSITMISENNWTPEHLINGVLRGVAQELRALVDELAPALRDEITHLVGAGSGVRRNAHLAKALTRAFELPLSLPAHEEEAARGAALYAGIAAGYYENVAAAMRLST